MSEEITPQDIGLEPSARTGFITDDALEQFEEINPVFEDQVAEGDILIAIEDNTHYQIGRVTNVTPEPGFEDDGLVRIETTNSEFPKANSRRHTFRLIPEHALTTTEERDNTDEDHNNALTQATNFTVVSEELIDRKNDRVQDGLATPTTLSRWQKHGKDRVYLNGSNTIDGSYLDLETGEYHIKDRRRRTVECTRDGADLTIVIDDRNRAKITITLTADGLDD